MKIIHYADVEPASHDAETPQRNFGRVVIGKADGAENYCMRVFEVREGGSSPFHAHDWEHEIFVHAGRGTLWRDGEEVAVGPGSVAFIPGGETHRFKNTGAEPLIFVCVIPAGPPEF